MARTVPTNGQTVVFTVVPTGSYCTAGEVYRVEHNGKKGHDFRFVSVDRGSSTYDRPWAVAQIWLQDAGYDRAVDVACEREDAS